MLSGSATSIRSTAQKVSSVALAGIWRGVYVDQISEHFDVWQLQGYDIPVVSETSVSWLMAGSGVDPSSISKLVGSLRRRSPRMRLGVVGRTPGCFEANEADLYIPANAQPADVVAAMRLAHGGFVIGESGGGPRHQHRLTNRERELLDALCTGLGNDQIARAMSISRRTVEFHLTRIFRKLGVASRVEAILRAQQ